MISQQKDIIKTWLFETHRITVQDDWLEACLEWIQEENQGTNIGEDGFKNMVFEQWLMSDLRELHNSCLPDDLAANIKTKISGNFPLQIESVIDVGSSCYSQLQKVQGSENANVGVSADTSIQPSWEQKPSKMLYLKLTDGVIDLQGMEYKPIASLSVDTIPGTKILVYGDVVCRRGVLLLTEDNTHVYGGEVDSLIESNTPLTNLQKALEYNKEFAGQTESSQFSGRFIERGDNSYKKTQSQSYKCSQVKVKSSTTLQNNMKSQMPSNKNFQTAKNQQRQVTANVADSGWDDDFEEDIFMDDIDDNVLLSMEDSLPENVTSSKENDSKTCVERTESNVCFDNGGNESYKSSSTSLNSWKRESPACDIKQEFQNKSDSANNLNYSNRIQGVKSQRESSNTPVSRSKRQKIDPKQQSIERMFTSTKNITKSLNFDDSKPMTSASNDQLDDVFEQFDDDFEAVDFESLECSDNSSAKIDVPKAVIRPFNSSCVTVDLVEMDQVPQESTVNTFEPFTYLSTISADLPFTEEKTFKVKAYISTLISKLTSGQGEGWTLACKINDGTMAMNVDLSNKVLTELIGFSAQDSIVMRRQARTDSSVKNTLLEGIQQCQQKLVDLSCILEIKVEANSTQPTITNIVPVRHEHVTALLDRVKKRLS